MTSVIRGSDNFDSSSVKSMVRVHTANGNGSTNTAFRRFTTVVVNQGSDITYADSATLGGSFTINANGVYGISYAENFANANEMGISLNSSQGTTSITAITVADRLANSTTGGASFGEHIGWIGYLPAGSVIRAHTATSPAAGTNDRTNFTIVRIA